MYNIHLLQVMKGSEDRIVRLAEERLTIEVTFDFFMRDRAIKIYLNINTLSDDCWFY